MRRSARIIWVVGLCLSWFAAAAQTNSASAPAVEKLPGQRIAQTVSLITGVAISPLLGVGSVGAWEYYHAETPEQKARLPWYANPWFWAPALLLVAVCFVKDTAGASLPVVLKKPMDVAEAIEHKISGLIAVGLFVPLAASIFHAPIADGAALNSLGFAAIEPSWIYNAVSVPLAMIAFVVVFLASNAINILILLSPFPVLDAALKGFRTAVLASVAASAWFNPWIGAAWALFIIGFSWLIAGWSFRLSCLGWVFVWDIVTGKHKRFVPDGKENEVFLARKIDRVPARTLGKLVRGESGRLVLRYRPWLVLPARELTLPEGRYEAGRGLLYSEISLLGFRSRKSMIFLPPRFRGHEDELTRIYGLDGGRDTGLRALWNWVRQIFGGKSSEQAA